MKLFGKKYNKETKHFERNILGIRIRKKDRIGILQNQVKYLVNVINSTYDITKFPKAEGDLRQWQLELLDLLKDFDNICRENGVQYWLDFGTLLGAIRHKGFVPWDDDIDTSMLKKDIDKILPVIYEHFKNSNYFIRKKADGFSNFQIKICNKNYSLALDIFPVYEYPSNEYTKENVAAITTNIIEARKVLENKYSDPKHMSDTDLERAYKDVEKIQNEMIIPQDKEYPQNPILFHGIDFPYEEGYYVMPNDEIFPLIEVEFEGEKFFAPNKSEQYLSNLWPNWKQIPNSVGIYRHFYEDFKSNKYEEV